MRSRNRKTSKHRWNNVAYVNVEKRRVNFVFFKVVINNVKQRRNNIVIFNVEFYDVDQRRNNFVNINICKKLKNELQVNNSQIFSSLK